METKLNLSKESTTLFLLLLLSTDIVFIGLHIMHTHTGYLWNPNLSLEMDRGYAEVFQYIKEYWIALIFLYLAIKKRNLLYLTWSLLFGYLLLDDSFEIHERLGEKVSAYFNFPPLLGLDGSDFGELTVSAFFGSIFFISMGVTYYLSECNVKTTCRRLLLLLLALVLFGVVIDTLHGMVDESHVWDSILAVVEDGGEMLVMSVIAWFAFLLPDLEQD